MPRHRFRTVFLEGSPRRRRALERLLSARPGRVAACSRSSVARRELRSHGADLLLAPTESGSREELTHLACQAGLEVPLLFRPAASGVLNGRLYLGQARFGTLKWADQLLAACGAWWYLHSEESTVHDRYRKLINRFGDGYLELGPDDTVRWANAVLRRATGGWRLEGSRLEDLVEEADAVRWRAVREQQTGGVIIPFMARLRNGTMVEIDPTPRYDSEGEYLGSAVVIRGLEAPDEEQLEHSRALVTLYGLTSALSQSLGLCEVLEAVLEQTLKLGGLRGAGVLLDGSLHLHRGVELAPEDLEALARLCAGLSPRQKARVIRHMTAEEEPAAGKLYEAGLQGLAVVPLLVHSRRIGHLWVIPEDSEALHRETVSLLISIGAQAGVAVENARLAEARLEAEVARRQVYRDALQAVTGGKLVLCEYAEIEEVWAASGERLVDLELRVPAHVPRARRCVEQVMFQEGFSRERCSDLALCVSEAATNVLKYGPPGRLRVRADERALRIRLDDSGPGIDFAHLSGALLRAGYSTTPSLGLGYSILLELTDGFHLATGERGTVLILEALRQAPDPLEVFTGLQHGTDAE